MNCAPPGSSVHGISQARILEWAAISSSRGPSQPGIKLASPALAGGFFTTEPYIHSWTLSLLPRLGNCKQRCNKCGGADIFWSYYFHFLWVNSQTGIARLCLMGFPWVCLRRNLDTGVTLGFLRKTIAPSSLSQELGPSPPPAASASVPPVHQRCLQLFLGTLQPGVW